NIGAAIDLLYGAGGRSFLVPNLSDGGLTPGSLVPALDSVATLAFNQELAIQLAARMALPGIQIITFDTFGFLNQVVSDPAAYGFANVSEPCYAGPVLGFPAPGPACPDDDAYLFWDASGHPTARAHALLGEEFADALEP